MWNKWSPTCWRDCPWLSFVIWTGNYHHQSGIGQCDPWNKYHHSMLRHSSPNLHQPEPSTIAKSLWRIRMFISKEQLLIPVHHTIVCTILSEVLVSKEMFWKYKAVKLWWAGIVNVNIKSHSSITTAGRFTLVTPSYGKNSRPLLHLNSGHSWPMLQHRHSLSNSASTPDPCNSGHQDSECNTGQPRSIMRTSDTSGGSGLNPWVLKWIKK